MSDLVTGIVIGCGVTSLLLTWLHNREHRDWVAISDRHWEYIRRLHEGRCDTAVTYEREVSDERA